MAGASRPAALMEPTPIPYAAALPAAEAVVDYRVPAAAAPPPALGPAWPFAATVFAGAFLLFQVQPLIGKYVLPWFGGGPAVWTTCMLFFQVLLLGGYAYAHLLVSRLRPRRQVVVHLVVLAAALCLLPVWPSDRWKPVGLQRPIPQILLLLAACVGLPYFALAATGPLLQAWFGRVRPGRSPYRLYALSNVGSLLALLSYPVAFEPNLPRRSQALLWSVGLGGFALLCATCGRLVWRAGGAPDAASADEVIANPAEALDDQRTSLGRRALWVLLPACASALLLAVTNKLCQDVAVVPFLWVVPLAVYLLSFVVAFDGPRWYWRPLFVPAAAVGLGLLAKALNWGVSEVAVPKQIGIYCGGLFACCMACHGELYRLRPPARRLTGFYLSISAGGALGGLFVSVVAPAVFPDYFELHVVLFACAILLLAALAADPVLSPLRRPREDRLPSPWRVLGGVVLAALTVATGWLGWVLYQNVRQTLAGQPSTRNFYGVLRVYEEPWTDGSLRRLQHGAILHGAQFTAGDRVNEPITYYGPASGIGLAMDVLRSRPAPLRIGVVGLGVGTMAAHGRAGDRVTFYEIDPAVKAVASTQFTYLSGSKAAVDVVLGDARLSLEQQPAQDFDLLALDAFSSDAIPVHLLTKEALAVYARHLKPDGVLAVHVSNRHLDLAPIVYRTGALLGYRGVSIEDAGDDDDAGPYDATDWILLTRGSGPDNVLDSLPVQSATKPPPAKATTVRPWTDEDANLYQVLKF